MNTPLIDLRGSTGKLPDRPGLPHKVAGHLYGLCALVHARLARRSRLVTRKPLISLGNLEVGGTGKTPATLAVARLLLELGRRPGVITGMAGQGESAEIIRSDAPIFNAIAPDEARLLASRLPGCPLLAARRKWRGAQVLDADPACDVILLDDGFQHHRLARDLDLVLISGREPLTRDRVLPGGGLREFPGALQRASGFILPESASEDLLPPGRPRFRYSIVREGLFTVDGERVAANPEGYVCVSGMAAPERFERSAAEAGQVVGRIRFRDHASWTGETARTIRDVLRVRPGALPLITEKDAARWQNEWDPSLERPHVLRIEFRFSDPAGLSLWLENTLRAAARDQSSSA